MTSVLVTGAGGQLGRSIREIAPNYPQIRFVFKDASELDILSSKHLRASFDTNRFDYCINCAAYTDVEKAESEPDMAFKTNAEGVHLLAKHCLEFKVCLIHISTDYVFDGLKRSPYTPEDKTNPINVYGASKLKGEEFIKGLLKRYFIVRTSWLYSEYGRNFYKAILQKARNGEHLKVTDDQLGCPTHAVNLSSYILQLVTSKSTVYGVHHFTDGEAMTWYDFAKRILQDKGLEKTVNIEKVKNYRTFAKRPEYSVLAHGKI